MSRENIAFTDRVMERCHMTTEMHGVMRVKNDGTVFLVASFSFLHDANQYVDKQLDNKINRYDIVTVRVEVL